MSQYKRRMSNVCLSYIIGSFIQLVLTVVQFSTFSTQWHINQMKFLFKLFNRHFQWYPNADTIKEKKKKAETKRNHNRWLLIKSKISDKHQHNKHLKINSIFHLSSWISAIEQFIGVFVTSNLQFTIYNFQLQYHMRRLNTRRSMFLQCTKTECINSS